MQSIQLPNVGILRSKKGYNGEGAEVGLKAFVKYATIGSCTKSLNGIPIWRTLFTILVGNEVFLPSVAGRVNAVESKNWGLCSRPF